MIIFKSDREIQIMREAGRIVAQCHAALKKHIQPGITTKELDRIAENFIQQTGATPSFKGHHGFPACVCTSINDIICHGIPDQTELRAGDVITIDIGVKLNGYHGDSGWSYAVGQVRPEIDQLMKVTKECLDLGIQQARPGKRIGDIGAAIQTYAEGYQYGVVREFCGHGIGRDLWEEPEIPHYGRAGRGPLIKPGMVIAIEPMITNGGWQAQIDKDGWTARTVDHSICIQYEHTIAVLEDETIILTQL
ncbi:type I methionyl aminopeptidase [Sporomusa sphaeroides DSM 2875]|uniref:type I methionyl aminopeptidase n=1 Tax=Sporomusa sphaeroides TaxID=47679 RepID=UPI00202E9F90|nr:type I methionyl aminopeptidase [Sporomusa sphaeroides]MCM0760221.1 type I methionyl aminopeptidase [Sporomusa sphaeroides DSM 2875]